LFIAKQPRARINPGSARFLLTKFIDREKGLEVLEAEDQARFEQYQWIDWRKDRLEFCAVSDAAPVDLRRLQPLLALSSTITAE
jgi:hypothetical protein